MRLKIKATKKTSRTSIKAGREAHRHRRLVRAMMLCAGCAILTTSAVPALGQVAYEDLKLQPNNGMADAFFGSSIDIDNGIVAIGAYRDSTNGWHAGSAYLFDASTGDQLIELDVGGYVSAGSEYGWSIAIDDGIVAVGQHYSSRVHLFDASSGEIVFVLDPNMRELSRFGDSVAIDNGVVAVGAPLGLNNNNVSTGVAYLYDVNTGDLLHTLQASNGRSSDEFGLSIAIDNGTVAVGGGGAVHLFDVVTGEQLFKLVPGDDAQLFGYSVALDNGVVAVGAPFDTDNGYRAGSAFLFDVSTGTQFAKLLPSDGAAEDKFGFSIVINNGNVLVGSVFDNWTGSVYLFDALSGDEVTKYLASDGDLGDSLGHCIAMDEGVIVVGASSTDTFGSGSGSAYVFSISCPGAADVNHDGYITPADFSAWIAAFNAGAPECDQNGDGSCTPADFTAWIANFNAGC